MCTCKCSTCKFLLRFFKIFQNYFSNGICMQVSFSNFEKCSLTLNLIRRKTTKAQSRTNIFFFQERCKIKKKKHKVWCLHLLSCKIYNIDSYSFNSHDICRLCQPLHQILFFILPLSFFFLFFLLIFNLK